MKDTLLQLRRAHITFPELREISVYVRNNTARRGDIKTGDETGDLLFTLYDLQGRVHVLGDLVPKTHSSVPLILIAGSYT